MLALSCLAVSVQAATGLEPGVHADPGSPAAKEYALPLNQARQAGERAGSHASSGSTALFGAGIKPPGSGGSSGSGASGRADARAGGAQPSAHRNTSGPAPSNQGSSVPAIMRAARSQASSSGSGSLLTLLGGGVAILVLGAFGGTVMRRSRRSSAPARPANSA